MWLVIMIKELEPIWCGTYSKYWVFYIQCYDLISTIYIEEYLLREVDPLDKSQYLGINFNGYTSIGKND